MIAKVNQLVYGAIMACLWYNNACPRGNLGSACKQLDPVLNAPEQCHLPVLFLAQAKTLHAWGLRAMPARRVATSFMSILPDTVILHCIVSKGCNIALQCGSKAVLCRLFLLYNGLTAHFALPIDSTPWAEFPS